VSGSAAPQAVTLSLLPNVNGCNRRGSDATPWVTPDGLLLLFRSIEIDAACATQVDSSDLWYARLDDQGQPLGPATAITDVNMAAWDDSDPTLSPDLCWLYYATDQGPPTFEYDVRRAPRR